MSDLWFNIRFGTRHLQLTRDWKLSFSRNYYWTYNKPIKWFAVYCLFGHHYNA